MAFSPARLPFYTPSLPHSPLSSASTPLPRPGTVPTRILLLSDTHNTALFPPNDVLYAFKAPLPRADVALHAGDLSNFGTPKQLGVTLQVLKSIEAELKLVIAGNHDLTLDAEYWREFRLSGGRRGINRGDRMEVEASEEKKAEVEEQIRGVREMWTGEEARRAGIVYLDEGVHSFELRNGAKFTVYASPYSPEFFDWAFMYPRNVDRFNATVLPSVSLPSPQNPIPSYPEIDLVMTHGPPAQILDRVNPTKHTGCANLARALGRVRPRLHVFGHIHEDWGAMRVNWDEGKGECVDITGRRKANGDGNEEVVCEEPDEEWNRIIQRGYVALDLTGTIALGEVKKGRRREGEVVPARAGGGGSGTVVEEETGGEATATDVLALPQLKWGHETLCINAAIMDARFRPKNAPIVVDLLLPGIDAV